MKVKILLFAHLKEAYGSGDFWLDMPAASTIQDAVSRVMGEKKLSSFKNMPLRFAVNEEFRYETQTLNDHDSLAFLSPMAGG